MIEALIGRSRRFMSGKSPSLKKEAFPNRAAEISHTVNANIQDPKLRKLAAEGKYERLSGEESDLLIARTLTSFRDQQESRNLKRDRILDVQYRIKHGIEAEREGKADFFRRMGVGIINSHLDGIAEEVRQAELKMENGDREGAKRHFSKAAEMAKKVDEKTRKGMQKDTNSEITGSVSNALNNKLMGIRGFLEMLGDEEKFPKLKNPNNSKRVIRNIHNSIGMLREDLDQIVPPKKVK